MALGSKKCKKPLNNANAVAIQGSKAKQLVPAQGVSRWGLLTSAYVEKAQLVLHQASATYLGLLTPRSSLFHLLLGKNEQLQPHPLPRNPAHTNALGLMPTSHRPQLSLGPDSGIVQLHKNLHHDIPIGSDWNVPHEDFTFTDPQEGAKEFLSALDDGAMLSDPEFEGKSEDFSLALDAISSVTNNMSSESSGTDDAFLQSSLPPPGPTAVKKKAKSTSAKRGGTSTTQACTAQSTYDPQTCCKYCFQLIVILLC
ncbi:hypothetical protein J3R83DRAFT_8710 [Lanmaoa asiatica]|nr:hypothetical protein J3R83DRAFT_8710 [Lanmaoa asiatica]